MTIRYSGDHAAAPGSRASAARRVTVGAAGVVKEVTDPTPVPTAFEAMVS